MVSYLPANDPLPQYVYLNVLPHNEYIINSFLVWLFFKLRRIQFDNCAKYKQYMPPDNNTCTYLNVENVTRALLFTISIFESEINFNAKNIHWYMNFNLSFSLVIWWNTISQIIGSGKNQINSTMMWFLWWLMPSMKVESSRLCIFLMIATFIEHHSLTTRNAFYCLCIFLCDSFFHQLSINKGTKNAEMIRVGANMPYM